MRTTAMVMVVMATLAGCGSPGRAPEPYAHIKTPYDSMPSVRAAYVEGYLDGHSVGVKGIFSEMRSQSQPYREGYRAGNIQGLKKHDALRGASK